ncbi:MAG: glucose-1-phosphate cytidylyltransferase [Legionellales bacterium]|nr:glucose-1-phosphate cytidylyltransferase [Legionellales bacterium]
MQAVILAGGFGTRIAEESDQKPKPMVEIGGKPLLWHIMKTYSHYGINDFIICLGYKGYYIKEFFFNYYKHTADLKVNLRTGDHQIINSKSEDWNVTLIDTGIETLTGGRIKRIEPYLHKGAFCLTYGDGLADIDIGAQLKFHQQHQKLATIAAVQPPGRFGVLHIEEHQNHQVNHFAEKPSDEMGWINGGFFILEPQIMEYIQDDTTIWEQQPLQNLAADGQLMAFLHKGFWQPCDTLRDKRKLEQYWQSGHAAWMVWE